ncbi:DMT family transporter [Burkholderia pseudomultivorans]|uniref:DMT family transporter n=1 Tax=Burkholderia pseudomultivorans TaxID=1207504 RepID=UPI00075509CB|nr:DMT family transporter [Burkholderia pseudomultivorans]KVG64536.1 hypothetical protein WS80_19815 [Burkholderia pseudomultivorans]
MIQAALLSILTIVAGVSLMTQQVLNANLRGALNSAAWSGVASYALGLACMAVLALVLRDPLPSSALAARIPWWAFSGGLFGAIFIALAIFTIPKLGAASFLVLVVTGQILASMTIDHFGWFGLVQRPVDVSRLVGIALLIGGCVLIRR